MVAADDNATTGDASAPRLINRLLLGAIVINIGANFAAGTYDVI
jgi:hypothetical protein